MSLKEKMFDKIRNAVLDSDPDEIIRVK